MPGKTGPGCTNTIRTPFFKQVYLKPPMNRSGSGRNAGKVFEAFGLHIKKRCFQSEDMSPD